MEAQAKNGASRGQKSVVTGSLLVSHGSKHNANNQEEHLLSSQVQSWGEEGALSFFGGAPSEESWWGPSEVVAYDAADWNLGGGGLRHSGCEQQRGGGGSETRGGGGD